MRSYQEDYGYAPLNLGDARCNSEGLGTCCQDGSVGAADITEGFATALLRDIEDSNPTWDDHDATPLEDCNGDGIADCVDSDGDGTSDDGPPHLDCNGNGLPDCDCDVDAMALGVAEIFMIVREDQPHNVLDFINSWRFRYPEHDMDFWLTTRNISAGVFGFLPQPVPAITSPSQSCMSARVGEFLSIEVTGNGSLFRFQWRRDGVNLTDTLRTTGTTSRTLLFNPLLGEDGACPSNPTAAVHFPK